MDNLNHIWVVDSDVVILFYFFFYVQLIKTLKTQFGVFKWLTLFGPTMTNNLMCSYS